MSEVKNQGLLYDEGLRKIIGLSSPEFTLVDYPTAERRTTRMCGAMDDRSVMNLKSSDRLKQEKNVFHYFSTKYGTIIQTVK